jgi:hypothetical protein
LRLLIQLTELAARRIGDQDMPSPLFAQLGDFIFQARQFLHLFQSLIGDPLPGVDKPFFCGFYVVAGHSDSL